MEGSTMMNTTTQPQPVPDSETSTPSDSQPPRAQVSVAIVDDHQVVRIGLQQLLELDGAVTVVGAAGDGAQAIALVSQHHPDLVLMDISMPVLDGIEATRRIKSIAPQTCVVVLSSYGDEDHVTRALEAGADGYLLKHSDPRQLLQAIRDSLSGGLPLSAEVARVLVDSKRSTHSPDRTAAHDLTEREREVLLLVTKGLANKQIAIRLGIAERTVKAHLSNVFNRLGVTDRTSAAMWAREHLVANPQPSDFRAAPLRHL